MTPKWAFFPRTLICLWLPVAGAQAIQAAPRLAAASGGHVRAVVIGIDHYANFGDLQGARADAEDLRDALQSGGADVYRPLLDEDATRDAVVKAMDWLVAESRPGDLAVITYSGHGARVPEYDFPGWKGLEPDGMNEEFVLSGYATAGPGAREVIINKEMKAWLGRLDAKGTDVLFVADTCFGGGAVRSFDPRAGSLTYRGIRSPLPNLAAGQFTPIAMTPAELQSTVADLSHVTFLAGADRDTQVPEIEMAAEGSTGKHPRGVLSYTIARALRQGLPDSADGAVTREALDDQALQIVHQYTDGLQTIDFEPRVGDGGKPALGRTVFRLIAQEPARPAASVSTGSPVRLAFIDGDGSKLLAALAGGPPVQLVAPEAADLVWDVGTGDALSRGDVIRHRAEPDDFLGVVSRTAAVAAIKALSEEHVEGVQLDLGGRTYTPEGEKPTLRIAGLDGRDLVVLNLTSNGIVQVLWPGRDEAATFEGPDWSFSPDVVAPFGADQVVAVTGPKGGLDELAAWSWSHQGRPAAALLPERLRSAMAADPGIRLGTVDLFTAP